MHTESEARGKWCPFARVIVEAKDEIGIAAANRMPGVGGAPDPDLDWPSPRCIASDCAAWRWGKADIRDFDMKRLGAQAPGAAIPDTRLVGFCGLAGRP